MHEVEGSGPHDLLSKAIQQFGSRSDLAAALGVSVSTLRRWQARGIPAARTALLRRYLERAPGVPLLTAALDRAGSVKALAQALGVTPSTIRRWKSSAGVPVPQHGKLESYLEGTLQAPAPPAPVALEGAGEAPAPQPTPPRPPRLKTPWQLLKAALKKVKSAARLAAELGLTPATVQRWARRKKPSRKGLVQINAFLLKEEVYESDVERERARLKELLGFAGELDKLPDHLNDDGPRNGPRTEGWRYSKHWKRELTTEFINQAERWVLGLKRRHKFWQAIVRMLHFDPKHESEFKRSGDNVPIQLGPNINDYLVDATLTTIRVGSAQKLAGELRGTLEDVIEQGFYAYVVGITVFNYRLRTEEERLIWMRTRSHRAEMRRREQRRSRKTRPSPPKK